MRDREDIEAMLFRLADTTSPLGCWPVSPGHRTGRGYGSIGGGGRRRRWLLHRLAYTLWVGEIPPGMQVLHRCDNPPCVNPQHLFLGTQADNMADKVAKGRQARGLSNGMGKLSEEQIEQARRRMAAGETQAAVARELGVHPGTIGRRIVRSVVTGR